MHQSASHDPNEYAKFMSIRESQMSQRDTGRQSLTKKEREQLKILERNKTSKLSDAERRELDFAIEQGKMLGSNPRQRSQRKSSGTIQNNRIELQTKVFQMPSNVNALDMVMSLPSTKNAETPIHTKSMTKVFNSAATDQKLVPPETAYLEDSKNPNSGIASPKTKVQPAFASAKRSQSPKGTVILSSHTPAGI